MGKFKMHSRTDINKDALKNVFLHGKTHADMSIFPINSQDVVSSYDTVSIYEDCIKCMKIVRSEGRKNNG